MRLAALIFGLVLCPMAASAGLLEPSEMDAARLLPPPPAAGSSEEKTELAELRAIATRTTPQELAAATHDSEDETPDIFDIALGFDTAARPQTFKLLTMVMAEEDGDSKAAKAFFHRLRPYSIDQGLKTCEPVKPGKAANSYPSGHSSLAFSIARLARKPNAPVALPHVSTTLVFSPARSGSASDPAHPRDCRPGSSSGQCHGSG